MKNQENEKESQAEETSKDASKEETNTEEALNEVVILFPEEKKDINSSLERHTGRKDAAGF